VKLLELQRRMAADLLRPLTPSDNLSPKSKASDYITANSRLTSHERLQIYARSYWYRILDSLYEDFPGVRAIIGDEAFHQISRAYLAARPSQSFSLRNLGEGLESWLRSRRQYTGGKHALVMDMVRLEWAHIEAFDGLGVKPLEPEDLLELGPELRMTLQPYLGLLELRHAVDDLRIGVSRPTDLHQAASNAVTAHKQRKRKLKTIPREKAPLYLAVHRYHDMVYYRRMPREAFRILASLRSGDTIGSALESGFEGSALSPDDYQAAIAQWFGIWAELGWLCPPAA
jgi:hypothetical protein